MSWELKVQKWIDDIERKKIENKEQWDARRQKMKDDFDNWQRDTEKGFKKWKREMLKGSYGFLLFMIPILVVLFAFVFLIAWLFSLFQQ